MTKKNTRMLVIQSSLTEVKSFFYLYLQNGSLMDGSFNGESYHQLQQWSLDGYHQPAWGREEDHHEGNFLMGSTTLHPNQVKMEL